MTTTPLLDEDEVNELFDEFYAETLKEYPNDKPRLRGEYSMFVDSLHREGRISDETAFSVVYAA